jgi:hypothetical protein
MKIKIYFVATLALLFTVLQVTAQTNAADSVFIKQTFGTGTTKTNLPAGRTTYAFNANTLLEDGDYMIYNYTNGRPEWHNTGDHTGNTNGRAMVINAGYGAAEFYRDTIYNVASGFTYSVYLYVMNTNTVGTCGPAALLPKLEFIVEYYNQATNSYTQLNSFSTAFIPQTTLPLWIPVGSTFVVPAGANTIRYRILNNSTGGCGNDLAIDDITFARANAIPGALPVTGLQAAAQRSGNGISVQWETISEYNSSHFIVQKSNDASNWYTIDSVAAQGYSDRKHNYSVVDAKAADVTYYRIKQVDVDGKFTYSNIVRMKQAATTATATTFPNPFVNQVQVDIKSEMNNNAVLTINEMSGKKLLQKTLTLVKGNNSFTLSQVQQFAAGVYILNICNEDGVTIYKTKIVKN